MNRSPLESTLLGTNTNNKTTSPIDSIPVRTKMPEPTPLTRPTELVEENGKSHVPGEPDQDPSSSNSSSNKSNLSKCGNYSKSTKNKLIRRKIFLNIRNRTS